MKKTEVKQRGQNVFNEFAFKSGANKKAWKINTTLNKRREEEMKCVDDTNNAFFESTNQRCSDFYESRISETNE